MVAKKKKGALGIDFLSQFAVGMGTVIITVAVIAMMLVAFTPATKTTTSVVNDMKNSSGTVPEIITVTYVNGGVNSGSETIDAVDVATSTTTRLTLNQNYTVISYTAGTFNITSAKYINATSDYYNLNYTYQRNTNATTIVDKGLLAIVGFSDWFLILIIVGIAVVLLSFVMMLRYMGGGGGRGKA